MIQTPIRLLVILVLVVTSLAISLITLSPLPIWAAASYTVNSLSDPGTGACDATECTLREAINAANASSGIPDTIDFSVTGVITLSAAPGPLPTISDDAGVILDGDVNNDGNPDIAVSGLNLTSSNASGIRIQSQNNTVSGLAIYGFPGFGLTITGTGSINNQVLSNTIGLDLTGSTIGNGSDVLNNGDGIILRNGTNNNTIRGNTIGGNLRHGISLSGGSSNTITFNFIGVSRTGLDRGNGENGIMLKDGTSNNLVQNNQSMFNNRYGIYVYGGTTPPPQGNQIIGNSVAYNDSSGMQAKAGIVNQKTHRNSDPTVPAQGDNLIQSNQIFSNTGIGIYNIGASPLITGNSILSNTSYGIFNSVDYGASYSPATVDDDLLSMPGIYNNTLYGNGDEGIRSIDTRPINGYTLAADNTIGNNNGAYDVHQVWFGAVEVLAGTTTISNGLNISLYSQSAMEVQANTYAAADATQGFWSKGGSSYANETSWLALDEYVVQNDGSLLQHSPYTVSVSGAYSGSVLFSFDGISTTHPVAPIDYNLPFGQATGVTSVPAHTLHRYQIAEVNRQDSDGDGIPDSIEVLCTAGIGSGYPPACDTDGDGVADYMDTDSDNDGVGDSIEGSGESSDDTDQIPNFRDIESDGDGIEDWVEAGCANQPTGGDTCPDPARDGDGDSIPDRLDLDSDGDGFPDAKEYYAASNDSSFCFNTTLNTDSDTTPNCQDNDADGDGRANYRDLDSDGDGALDSQESKVSPEPPPQGHADVPAWLDPVAHLYLPIIVKQ